MADTLSDDDLHNLSAPASDDDGSGTPAARNTVEDNDHGPGIDDADDDDDDDLFGDGGDGDDGDDGDVQEEPAAARQLDDEDLDSGDDDGRNDRVEAQQHVYDEEQEQQTFNFMDADIARHCIPEPTDNELYLLKVPRFLSVEPTAFSHKTFQPPSTDHHSRGPASEHFSAYDTALSTIRWRRSPSNPSQLQSNARINRWSDGSLTLQLASDPQNQYEINANMLAPPQLNPKLPTPTQITSKPKQNQYKESYTYLVAPHEDASVVRVTNKFTTALSVVPTANTKDAALEKLQNDLAAAASRGRDEADQAISFIKVDEDPELLRAREEARFKESQKQARAREKHQMREAERANRALGRSGARSAGYGLSMGGLDENSRRGGAKKSKAKQDWSDDEDYGIRGKTREDDYDEEDDFIAASDEEPEIVEDDDDDDDGIVESPRHRREQSSPKRNRGGYDDSDEEVVVSRTKRRRVVDDDDEDE
ncbi:hypothetical protein BS50DRAFT_176901 [Corynespora cassiicola Philippines]|uniref:Leo1-domain-containing protein n=1 Tax=Corynespora cassiicola Philippines TaxID=1448308 RepID=A0A2T2P5U3_CORCC|nr:hypothetical protein BS50DRAFT_176901 [Corynespora cassiicola Philippines]